MPRTLPVWLLMLFTAMLATGTDEFVIAGVLPDIAADLDVSTAATGQLVTAFAVVYAVGAPTLAVLTDRFPRRHVIVTGLLLFTAANIAAAVAPGYWTLMVARVIAALAAASIASAAFATAAAGAPAGMQGRFLAIVTAGLTVALFTGVPLGTLLSGAYGWRAAFWVIAAAGFAAAVGLLLTAPGVSGTVAAPLRERLAPLGDRGVLRLVAVTFVGACGGLMFYNYLGPYMTEVGGPSYVLRTVMLLLVGLAGLGGVLAGGRVSDRLGPLRTLRQVLAGHVIALVLAALLVAGGVTSPLVLGAVIVLWSVFAWGFTPPLQGSVLAATPGMGTTAMALVISGMYLGTGVGAALGGVLVGGVGVGYVPVAAALLMLLALALTPRRSPEAVARERCVEAPVHGEGDRADAERSPSPTGATRCVP